MSALDFANCARLPTPEDNAAIATRRLEAGTVIRAGERELRLPSTVLEGHRFAYRALARGDEVLSWGLPFGRALRSIEAGEYLCNGRILEALAGRSIEVQVPAEPNFEDQRRYPDLAEIQIGAELERHAQPGTFLGYLRSGGRGVGTRNHTIALALTESSASLATRLAEEFPGDVVPVIHTEDGSGSPEHRAMLLRTLAGFLVHPNVGAALVVEQPGAGLEWAELQSWMKSVGYPLEHVRLRVLRRGVDWSADVERGRRELEELHGQARTDERSEQPLRELKLALQCGGSDAFSGVSGNALAGAVSAELIRHGGSAGLAETDELIGAESYILSNVRDEATARRFLEAVDRFQARAARHGTDAEGNPSGGNNLRGLYNIALKSIGAARKKDPRVRLDYVLDYGEPMTEPGYYFMDSPGNDLESLAGQVASGANLILFITGNGSITNFPFVPTLKFVTTTPRFEMLSDEMDVNAGRYADGESMEALTEETFELVREVAGGQITAGERAGHSQVSIWRAWRQGDEGPAAQPTEVEKLDGSPLRVPAGEALELEVELLRGPAGPAADQVGLIVPTSLCSGQIARLAAERLQERGSEYVSRFCALVHTEGCGSVGAEELFYATLTGHLCHPFTRSALLLEHGCEKTHNDAMRQRLIAEGVDPEAFGFASVQLDGGLEKVCDRIEAWFAEHLAGQGPSHTQRCGVESLRIGVLGASALPAEQAAALGDYLASVVRGGGRVVVARNAALWREPAFVRALLTEELRSNLAYGARSSEPGLYVMEAPGQSQLETGSALAATGVDVLLAAVASGQLVPASSPLVPLLALGQSEGPDIDVVWDSVDAWSSLSDKLVRCLQREERPRLFEAGHVGFQVSRGLMGISL